HIADLPEYEPVHPEPAPIIPDHAPLHPEDYLSDVEEADDVEEEPKQELKPELEFAPFAQATPDNMNSSFRMKEKDARVENKVLREMLKTAQERVEYHRESDEYYRHCLARVSWHYHQLSRWEFEIRWPLAQGMHYREIPYDPSTDPTMRARSYASYVTARDAATFLLEMMMIQLLLKTRLSVSRISTIDCNDLGNKRGWENSQGSNRNNHDNNRGNYRDNSRYHQYNNQRHGNSRAMTTAQNVGVNQGGPAPKCNSYRICHFGQCAPKCNKCGKIRHRARDYKGKIVVTGANSQLIKACYECGDR
nr:hypothetical protein [Tanacetum cinerariifolium]